EPDLIGAFHNNDAAAVDFLFRKYYVQLVSFARGITGSLVEGEDIVVETFLKLLRKRKDFTGLNNIKSFLYVTCRNACLDYLRYVKTDQKYRENKYLSSIVMDGEEYDVADYEQYDYGRMNAEIMQAIAEEIDSLPKRAKEVFWLIFFNKMTLREIAEHLGLHVNTIQTEKAKALNL